MDKAQKTLIQKELIEKYKSFLDQTKNSDEAYKWIAIEHFQQHWNLDAEDFGQMFGLSFRKTGNLFYEITWGFLIKAVEHFPKIVKLMFQNLYNEQISLQLRISSFQNSAKDLLPKLILKTGKQNLNHQQDERAIAIYLAFRFPEKYYLFMNSFYQAYCKLIGERVEIAGKKLIHFNVLAEDFKKEILLKDTELIKLHKDLNYAINWDDSNLIVQNILFKMLEPKISEKKFILANITWNSNGWKEPSEDKSGHKWVAKGGQPHESWNFDFLNPRNTDESIFGFTKFTNAPVVDGNNNLVVFYSQNKIVGFYGKSKILKETVSINDDESYNLIGDRKLSIHLEHVIDGVKEKGYFGDKKRIGQTGYIYLRGVELVNKILEEAILLNPKQENELNAVIEWVNDGSPSSPHKQTNYWIFQGNPNKYRIVEALRDGKVKSWSVSAHKSKIKIGDKVILWVTGDKSGCYALFKVVSLVERTEVDVEELEYYVSKSDNDSPDRVQIEVEYNWWDQPILKQHVLSLPEFAKFNGGKQGTNYVSTKEQYERLLDLQTNSEVQTTSINSMKIQPLNQILFGPPGTGKTYELQSNYFSKFTSRKTKLTSEEFKARKISELTWWETILAAMIDLNREVTVPELSNHPYIVLRSSISSSSNIRPTLWGQLQLHTITDCKFVSVTNRQDPLVFDKSKDSKWSIVKANAEIEASYIYEIVEEINAFKPIRDDEIKRFKFTTFHQNYAYEDFVMGIKPVMDDTSDQVKYTLEPGVFYKCCEEACRLAGYVNIDECINDTKENRKIRIQQAEQYALFIDEINRANISKVFGELITLIEEDKRLGSNHEIVDTVLPFKQKNEHKKFGIPANLVIIGTMNTADRSIALLDIALRRRFQFVEMMPKPELLSPANMIIRLWLKLQEIEFNEEPLLTRSRELFSLLGAPAEFLKVETQQDIWDTIPDTPLQSYDEYFTDHTFDLDLAEMLRKMNQRIEYLLDRDHSIGHSYFIHISKANDLLIVFKNKIIPLLQEYFYNDWAKIKMILNESTDEREIINQTSHFVSYFVPDTDKIFPSGFDESDDKVLYRINDSVFHETNVESIRNIFKRIYS